MVKVKSVIGKVIKVIIFVALGFLLFVLTVSALIQIPFIQTKIVHYTVSLVGDKTNTRVEIEKVSISFPKSIVVEGLYLEDKQKDTLIFAGKAKVDIALLDLFSNKININSFKLNDATVKLYNSKIDPLFNFDFLATAFTDTTSQIEADTLSAKKWVFNINSLYLKNFNLTFNDNYSGMKVNVAIDNSELNVDVIDFEKSIFDFDKMVIKGLNTIVQQKTSNNIKEVDSEIVMPRFSAKKLQIRNSIVNYIDSVGFMTILTSLDSCELKNVSLDLQKELLKSENINLANSEISYHDFKTEIIVDSISKSNWIVAVNNIFFNNVDFIYKVGDKTSSQKEFDPNNLNFDIMDLSATDFYFSENLTKVSVGKFSAINHHYFVINSLACDFSMDDHSIITKKLKLKTPNSFIDADLSIQFVSMETFAESPQFSILDLDMRNLSFKNQDVLYFSNALNEQAFFQNTENTTKISGKLLGSMDHLTGNNLVVKIGENTSLETDLFISGLPDFKTATFDFQNLKIHTGKKDIVMIAGSSLPQNIELPADINLQGSFNGKIKSFKSELIINSSFGDVSFIAAIDAKENFSVSVSMDKLDLGQFLKDTLLFGPVSLSAEAIGSGLDIKTLKAKIKADATLLFLNQYNYQNLSLNGTITGKQFEGNINLNDENAVFDFAGLVNLNKGQEEYKFRLNVNGADLQKLHIVDDNVGVSFIAEANLKGVVNKINGTAGVSDIIIVHNNKTYRLESLLSASVNEPERSEFTINSPLIGIKYSGTISPEALPLVLKQFINNYFPISDSITQLAKSEHSKFNFEIKLHNHPIFSEFLFPDLNEFIPGIITGSFDSEKNDLKLNASIEKIVYGTTEIKDFDILASSDNSALNFKISTRNISNSQVSLDNLLIDGNIANNKISTSISSIDGKKYKKLLLRSHLIKESSNYKLTLDPAEFYLMNKKWDIAADNYIEFSKQGFLVHHLFLNNTKSQLSIESVNDHFNEDLKINIKDFNLFDISGIFTKDSALVQGIVDGEILLKQVDNSKGIIADATIKDLFVRNIPIGNLSLKAENASGERFNFDIILSGVDNNLTSKGYFAPKGGDNSVNIKTEIQKLSMKTLEAFSMGQITEASGMLNGDFMVIGNTDKPGITGQLIFNNAIIKPAFINNLIELKNETIELKNDGIYFNNFTVSDPAQNLAILNGAVKMNQFSDFKFAFNITTKDFLLFNTSSDDSKDFFGKMIIDSKIDVTGPISLPVVKARLKLKEGSNFTFVVPEDRLTTDKGEDVVEFESATKLNPILSRNVKTETQKSGITKFDIGAIIEIDKEATLRLLMDPASTDSLVVKGEAALSFTMNQSGRMSLSGAYNLSEGSYLVSLESIIKKRFDIDAGSSIIWNGDPLDAEISINAKYLVWASPFDLVADQISGLSDEDEGQYMQRYQFIVLLKLRGKILQPEISFEIQLPPDEKGILGGSVNQKLTLLNEDPSSLNKQVFALLVLGRFVQKNPFQAEMGGASTLIRSTVGKFLSTQLNQLSSKMIPGIEMNFDIQSYDDYQSGQAKGRTQVEIGMKKQLFNERLSVQLGGTVDVEGDMAKKNSASDITSDITLEYKLNKDGSLRLKGFRHNQYEGAIEGQLVETGVGIAYVRDFNNWKRFFKSNRKRVRAPKPTEKDN